jgi:hypothetical protein
MKTSKKLEEGYLVEGDIILTEEDLQITVDPLTLRIAENEQYRTNNLVTGCRGPLRSAWIPN